MKIQNLQDQISTYTQFLVATSVCMIRLLPRYCKPFAICNAIKTMSRVVSGWRYIGKLGIMKGKPPKKTQVKNHQ